MNPEKGGDVMKKIAIYGALAAMLLAGIILCEMVMQFGSVFFLADAAMIAALIRYAKKGETKRGRKLAAIALAVLFVVLTLWTFNGIYGNPITKNKAKEDVRDYLEKSYPGKALYIESVSHNMSAGSYEAWIAGKDGGFYVSWRDGRILYDTFGEIIK